MPMICDLPLADPPVVTWKDWVNNVNREAIAVADEAGNINPAHPERDNFEVRGFAELIFFSKIQNKTGLSSQTIPFFSSWKPITDMDRISVLPRFSKGQGAIWKGHI